MISGVRVDVEVTLLLSWLRCRLRRGRRPSLGAYDRGSWQRRRDVVRHDGRCRAWVEFAEATLNKVLLTQTFLSTQNSLLSIDVTVKRRGREPPRASAKSGGRALTCIFVV